MLFPMAKKKYFPNNWKKLKDVPSEYFDSIEFDEFMDWKIGGYEIPSSVKCIIRETNLETGKVKEYTYTRYGDAKKKINAIMNKGESEFVVCDEHEIHYLAPQLIDDDDDPTV